MSLPSPRGVHRFHAALLGLLLAALTTAAYWEVADLPFVDYDDYVYITANAELRSGLDADAIRRAFTTTYGLRSNWIPLTALSFQLDHELYGLEAAGYHLTNLALHIASSLLLLLVLLRMTGAPGRSAFVAGLFALHPLHVESVAWVAERKDVLSAFFFMLTLCAYERYVRGPSRKRVGYLLTLLWLACGLLSKPMLVTLPAVLLLLDFWPLARIRLDRSAESEELNESNGGTADAGTGGRWPIFARLVAEKLPMVVLAAVASGVTLAVQASAGSVAEADEVLGLPLRVMNAVDAYCVYLFQAFWPTRLAVFYPHPMGQLTLSGTLGSGALLLLVSALVVWLARRRASLGYLPVGWFWFLGTLIPVIGLVQVGFQAHADRYMYLPLIGLALMLAWGGWDVACALTRGRRPAKVALAMAALAALLACGAATRLQVRYWRDLRTLFEHALEVTRGNFFAHNVLADQYLAEGALDAAQRHYEAANRLRPRWLDAARGLADVAAQRGQLEAAIERYEELFRRLPGSEPLLDHYATALMRAGRFDELISLLETLLSREPERADARLILAEVLLRMARPEAAVSHYRVLLSADPHHEEAHDLMGVALLRSGRVDEARAHHAAAARARPDWVVPQVGLARVDVERGEFDAAIERYRRWLPQSPLATTYAGLGEALIRAGRLGEAEAHFAAMKSDHPSWPEGHFGLGQLALARGEKGLAIGHYEAGLAIDPERAKAQLELGSLFAERGDAARALAHLERARALGIRSSSLEVKLGLLAQQREQLKKAIAHYRAALALDKGNVAATNNLAWILATSARPELRKPRAALSMAIQLTRDRRDAGADFMDTLAAAQAATGRYEEAAATALHAAELAEHSGNAKLAGRIRARAAVYRSGRPYRERPSAAGSRPGKLLAQPRAMGRESVP